MGWFKRKNTVPLPVVPDDAEERAAALQDSRERLQEAQQLSVEVDRYIDRLKQTYVAGGAHHAHV